MKRYDHNPFDYLRFDHDRLGASAYGEGPIPGDEALGGFIRHELYLDRQTGTNIVVRIARHATEMWCAGYNMYLYPGGQCQILSLEVSTRNGMFRTAETARLWIIGQLLCTVSQVSGLPEPQFADIIHALGWHIDDIRQQQIDFGDRVV